MLSVEETKTAGLNAINRRVFQYTHFIASHSIIVMNELESKRGNASKGQLS